METCNNPDERCWWLGGTRAARKEDVEKWSRSGSIFKVKLMGFGNEMDVWCEKRNSTARLRFWLKNGTMARLSTEKTKTARGACLECEKGGGQELGLEHGDVE